MLEPKCLRWALEDLGEVGEVRLVGIEEAFQLIHEVPEPLILAAGRDEWVVRRPKPEGDQRERL
jgi:hypothetical protein